MPIYEYACRECHHPFEVLQKMGADGDGLSCPACGSVGADRQLSTFAGLSGASGGSQRSAAVGGASAGACGPGGFT